MNGAKLHMVGWMKTAARNPKTGTLIHCLKILVPALLRLQGFVDMWVLCRSLASLGGSRCDEERV